MREEAPLEDGLILHSWGGNAAQVKSLSKLEGVYFSISGHSINGSRKKIRSMLKQVYSIISMKQYVNMCIIWYKIM